MVVQLIEDRVGDLSEVLSELVHVDRELIEREGAVCEEVAMQLATNVRRILHTDIGLAVTGIAGPGGGNDEYPIGTAFIAVDVNGKVNSERVQVQDNREANKREFAESALRLLIAQL